MPRPIGCSTGALAFEDFWRALEMLRQRHIAVVELSALRESELAPLLSSLDSLDLSAYSHVSFHAPSRLQEITEEQVSQLLRPLLPRRWPIIVHPDVVVDYRLWEGFGEWLCIENMDKRKLIGRTVAELESVFRHLPEASFCFDIGHARQVDPTMTQAALILRRFGERLKQVHISEVNSRSGHDPISYTALMGFRKVAHLIPQDIPIVLEAVIPEDQIEAQMTLAASALSILSPLSV